MDHCGELAITKTYTQLPLWNKVMTQTKKNNKNYKYYKNNKNYI